MSSGFSCMIVSRFFIKLSSFLFLSSSVRILTFSLRRDEGENKAKILNVLSRKLNWKTVSVNFCRHVYIKNYTPFLEIFQYISSVLLFLILIQNIKIILFQIYSSLYSIFYSINNIDY